jgi:hypothetical protein
MVTLGTAATNKLIVPAPGDYDVGEIGGMTIGRGNSSTLSKICPSAALSATKPHMLPGGELGPPR